MGICFRGLAVRVFRGMFGVRDACPMSSGILRYDAFMLGIQFLFRWSKILYGDPQGGHDGNRCQDKGQYLFCDKANKTHTHTSRIVIFFYKSTHSFNRFIYIQPWGFLSFLLSPTLMVTFLASKYSSRGIIYLRDTPVISLNWGVVISSLAIRKSFNRFLRSS